MIAGSVLGSYMTLQGRIATLSENVVSLQQQNNDLAKRLQQTQDDQRQFARDMAQTLTKVSEQLTDLRISTAGKNGKR